MTTPTRIDPVDWGDLCELALRHPIEAEGDAVLLEIVKMIQKRERENAAEKEAR